MKNRLLPLAAFAVFSLFSCQSDEKELQRTTLDLPDVPYQYLTGSDLPTLGRVLFYDNQLSLNNSVSCSSCHVQSLAFADNAKASTGFENRLTSRNSMPIQNLTDNSLFVSLFWDGRETSLQTMVLKPIVNHVEMGIPDVDQLAEKLQNIPYYQELFTKAYFSPEVTSDKIAIALSSFLRSIESKNTKLDRAQFGATSLSALESVGQQLFTETYDCNSCHQVQDPHGYIEAGTFANIGLDQVYTDKGFEEVTGNPADAGKFKIPSLRNVALTAPYMHDGRFETLDEVMEHYSEGIEDHPNLDPRLKSPEGTPMAFHIPEQDRRAIIAFLNTLTDQQMITDPRFSNPFKSR
jgi:cytochrome c peroxidase